MIKCPLCRESYNNEDRRCYVICEKGDSACAKCLSDMRHEDTSRYRCCPVCQRSDTLPTMILNRAVGDLMDNISVSGDSLLHPNETIGAEQGEGMTMMVTDEPAVRCSQQHPLIGQIGLPAGYEHTSVYCNSCRRRGLEKDQGGYLHW
jgi:hypothetical protein